MIEHRKQVTDCLLFFFSYQPNTHPLFREHYEFGEVFSTKTRETERVVDYPIINEQEAIAMFKRHVVWPDWTVPQGFAQALAQDYASLQDFFRRLIAVFAADTIVERVLQLVQNDSRLAGPIGAQQLSGIEAVFGQGASTTA